MLIAICLLSIFIITYVHSFLMDVSDDKYILDFQWFDITV